MAAPQGRPRKNNDIERYCPKCNIVMPAQAFTRYKSGLWAPYCTHCQKVYSAEKRRAKGVKPRSEYIKKVKVPGKYKGRYSKRHPVSPLVTDTTLLRLADGTLVNASTLLPIERKETAKRNDWTRRVKAIPGEVVYIWDFEAKCKRAIKV